MAELRYNINHSWRWPDGQCYTIVEYSVSYDPVKNESTVTFNRTRTRVWGHTGTDTKGTVSLTVRATDSGATASATSSPKTHFWNDGFTVVDVVTNPTSVTVKHSNTAGEKSIVLSSSTGVSHWENEWTTASGSTTVKTGTYTPPTYKLSISAGTGSTITVNRTSSSGGGATGNLSNGATLYADDKLQITFGASSGYKLQTNTVNGSTFTSGNIHTVSGNVTIVAIAVIQGLVYIYDGTSWNKYLVYIDNGTSWDMYTPYIDNGNGWDLYS